MYDAIQMELDACSLERDTERKKDMTDRRTKFTVSIGGSDPLLDEAVHEIAEEISSEVGGCSVTKGYGYWSVGGHQVTDEYDLVQKEDSYTITVSVLPDIDKSFVSRLQYLISSIIDFNDVTDVDWIHIEESSCVAHHFSVNDYLLETYNVNRENKG